MPNITLTPNVKVNLHQKLGTSPGTVLQVNLIGENLACLSGKATQEEADNCYVLVQEGFQKFIYANDHGAWCWCSSSSEINVQEVE